MQSFIQVVDKAAEVCGGQNALARRIGMTPSNMAAARAGKRPFTDQQIAEIAAIADMDPARLWELQQLRKIETKNPFRYSPQRAMSIYEW